MEIVTKTKWAIDPSHSKICFKIKHLKFSNISGNFREFDANIYTRENDFLTAQIDLWLNPASVDTGNEQRDLQLKSADFFNVEEFKVINFCAKDYVGSRQIAHYQMVGDLVMKGITHEIRLDVEFCGIMKDPNGNEKAIFTINGQINRKAWGLNWNIVLESGDLLLSEDVWIECDIQLIRQS